jgi:glyoxylase-like metal-dependent hydrolase (beta-lactamase superfamily II)
MRVGEFEVLPVVDGSFKVPASMFFPNVTEEDWIPHKRFLTDDNMIEMPVGGFLVRGSSTLALVDVGMGPVEAAPQFGGRLMDSLAAHGHSPDDVTDVLFSHLHFDHIGWASRDNIVQFPNATYRCHRKDWEYFVTDRTHQGPLTESLGLSPYADDWLGPVVERMAVWEGDATVLPGIDVRDAPGHTPGSTVMVVSSGAARAILMGDAVHCPAELLESEWQLLGDVDPVLAQRTREALAREYEGTDVAIGAPHFPDMQFGRLLAAEGRLNWVVA